MKDLFISHSHKDKEFVHQLAQDLRKEGISVWVDEEELLIGDRIIQIIQDAIDATTFLGVVVSKNSIQSGWVQVELEQAIDAELTKKEKKVLPIILGNVPSFPGFLRSKLQADFSEWPNNSQQYKDSLSLLVKSIKAGNKKEKTSEKSSEIITDSLKQAEIQFRQKIVAKYREEAPFFVPLTTQIEEQNPIQHNNNVSNNISRAEWRRRRRAKAEFVELTPGKSSFIRSTILPTLREGLEKYPCILLLGDAGAGKTTELENLAYQFVDDTKTLPLFLRLKEFSSRTSLEKFIELCLSGPTQAGYWEEPYLASNLSDFLNSGKLLMLFDALNEMPYAGFHNKVIDLRNYIDKWSKKGNRFVVSCRIQDFENALIGNNLEDLKPIELLPLNDSQVQAFIGKEFPEKIDREQLNKEIIKSGLEEMRRNPYLLTIMMDNFIESGRVGNNRVDLMSRFTQTLFSWAEENTIESKWIQTETLDTFLSMLAYEMGEHVGFGATTNTRFIKSKIKKHISYSPIFSKQFTNIEQMIILGAKANILKKSTDFSTISFHHQLLQEYFASKHIANSKSLEAIQRLLDVHLSDDRWRETILLLANSFEQPELFFEAFRMSIFNLISHEKELVNMLAWADTQAKIRRSKRYRLVALRCCCCSLYMNLDSFKAPYAVASAYKVAWNLDINIKKDIDADMMNILYLPKELGHSDVTTLGLEHAKKSRPNISLTKKQVKLAEQYFRANLLFIECLRFSGVQDQTKIEDSLLLPLKIQK